MFSGFGRCRVLAVVLVDPECVSSAFADRKFCRDFASRPVHVDVPRVFTKKLSFGILHTCFKTVAQLFGETDYVPSSKLCTLENNDCGTRRRQEFLRRAQEALDERLVRRNDLRIILIKTDRPLLLLNFLPFLIMTQWKASMRKVENDVIVPLTSLQGGRQIGCILQPNPPENAADKRNRLTKR